MLACLLHLTSLPALHSAVVINEFLAANSSISTDEHGDFDDWIELHNTGASPVNVGGWFLTDDLRQPGKWRIPADAPALTIIPAGGYLLVWADGEPAEGLLHAAFKLNAGGEAIGLFAADGVTLLDAIEFDRQDSDFSFGRYPDGTGGWQVMPQPTPGAANMAGYTGDVADTKFSLDRGFYELTGGFRVTISTRTPGATIYYTTDGTVPAPTNGTPYTGPIPIERDTVLRAAAYKPDWRPSDVDTHTYLVNADAARRSLPAISLVADPVTTFGTQGLFADALARGRAAEFPVSFEYLPADNIGAVQQDAGIRLQGSSYRRRTIGNNPNAKWSFKIYFRDDYGDGDTLDKHLIERSNIDRLPTLVLRSGYNDSSNPFIKDELGRRLFADMGQPSSLGTFVNLFINGQLKNNGYYNPTERIDEDTLRAKFGSDRDWEVATKWQPSGTAADPPRTHPAPYLFDMRDGDYVAFAALLDYALAHDLNQPAHYEEIGRRLDLVNFVDYLIIQGYSRIRDWPQNNWNAARERSDGELGKWKFYAWDLEFGWSSSELTDSFKTPPNSSDNPLGILYNRLNNNTAFRQLFADRAQKHFFNGGALTTSNVVRRFEEMRAVLAGVLPNMNTYIRNTFAVQRPAHVLSSLTSLGLFTHEGPRFVVNGRLQHGGEVPPGATLSMQKPGGSGTIYFSLDGSDPTNTVFPGALALNDTTQVKARLFKDGAWSGLVEALFRVHPIATASNLVVTELHYHPDPPTPPELAAHTNLTASDFEFIELLNAGAAPLDLPGVRFIDGIDFVFPDDGPKTLLPGERVVVAHNPTALTLRYGSIPRLTGPYRGRLDNAGERLAWTDAAGEMVREVRFNDRWYPITDGHGFSLVARGELAPAEPATRKAHWRVSGQLGGTPGAPDPGAPALPPVAINEALTHTDPPQVDAIELRNPTAAPAEVGGWFLTDDFSEPRKFRIPDGTVIPPQGYRVFTETDFNTPPGAPTAFSLRSTGDEVYLFSADAARRLTGYLHGFDFGAAANGVSFGREVSSAGDELFVAQTSVTLGTANPGPRIGPVVFTEIMYHPRERLVGQTAVDNVVEEFIELYNLTDAPVPLFDPAHPTNTWRVRGAVQFEFPAGFLLPARGYALLVGFNPDADAELLSDFQSAYAPPAGVPILGPFGGKLNNGGERLDLLRPGEPLPAPGPNPTAGEVPWVLVDRVRYDDEPPWPAGADGTGLSLQRVEPDTFGEEPTNWLASAGSPGRAFDGGRHPIILEPPRTQAVWPGSNAVLTVAATGTGPLRYQWQFNDAPISGATNDTLALSDVTVADEGRYTVTITDALGSITSGPAQLYVMTMPEIIGPPMDQTVVEGGDLTISMVITGSPPPFMYLLRRGSLPLQSIIRDERTCFFTLTNVQPDEGGLHRVVVTNAVVPFLRVNATFNLTVLPDFDRDGLPDEWEVQHGLNTNDVTDAALDLDGDGVSNVAEYRAGTDVLDAESYLRVEMLAADASARLTFPARANRTYTVEYTDQLPAGFWFKLQDLPARTNDYTAVVADPAPAPARFYRLVTPRQPAKGSVPAIGEFSNSRD